MMRAVDLFCGCGGLSLGFEKAGFEIVASYDNWAPAVATYSYNFKHPIFQMNIKDTAEISKHIKDFSPDIIIGGPPCQDFSSAGLRNEDNGRGDLTISYAEIVSAIRPEWFVMENVSTITKTNKLAGAKEIFRASGYGLSEFILDASLCGVPQKRKRFFMIGRLGEGDNFIKEFISHRISTKSMTVRDYLGDTLGRDFYYRHPRSYARRGIFSIDEPSPTIRGVNRPIPKGYRLHPNDPVTSLDGIKPLTTYERSLIQTFPADFIFSGNKSEVEQMIGNAVPVNLAYFVANAISDYRRTITPSTQTNE